MAKRQQPTGTSAKLVFVVIFMSLFPQTLPWHEYLRETIVSFPTTNKNGCQRLCWYWSRCVLYASVDEEANQILGTTEDECFLLSGTSRENQGRNYGLTFQFHRATPAGLPADHGCASRPCDASHLCVPLSHTFMCVVIPSDSNYWLGKACQSDDECKAHHSLCVNGQCVCKPYYVFSFTKMACDDSGTVPDL